MCVKLLLNTLYTHIYNTRSQIKSYSKNSKIQIPYVVYFNLPNHSLADSSVLPIEHINKQTPQVLNHPESYLIAKLHTLAPNDINVDE